ERDDGRNGVLFASCPGVELRLGLVPIRPGLTEFAYAHVTGFPHLRTAASRANWRTSNSRRAPAMIIQAHCDGRCRRAPKTSLVWTDGAQAAKPPQSPGPTVNEGAVGALDK